MNPRVVSAAALEGHVMDWRFDYGEPRRMDVRPYLDCPVFERLRDTACFALVQADHGTVSRPGGIDLDPDAVYLESVPVRQTAAAYAAASNG